MTWNIEGYSRNAYELRQIVDSSFPDLIFLSEAKLFQADANLATELLSSAYKYSPNSEDIFDQDLPIL